MVALNDSFPDPRDRDQERSALIRTVANLALKGELLRTFVPELNGYVELVVEVRNPDGWGFKRRPSHLPEVLVEHRHRHRQLRLFDPTK